jgi:hypothetical protein
MDCPVLHTSRVSEVEPLRVASASKSNQNGKCIDTVTTWLETSMKAYMAK